jgi:pimeloyl-ACP methyl ester carboxylesterase
MATFLLVHGSWHGAWCWERLAPRLLERGHRALAIDLPGHGEDRRFPWLVTLGGYSRRVQAAAAALAEKPVLVGHSMGGFAISQAAADAPRLFAALVYVCAFVPLPGETLWRLAALDAETLIPASVRQRPLGVWIRPAQARALFYADCSEADAAWATARLRSEPLRPLLQAHVARAPARLPRAYVECTRDRAVSLARQRAMAGRFDFDRVVTLASGHSPFLSQPEALADALDGLGRELA